MGVSRLGSLCGTLWHPMHRAVLCRTLWRVVLRDVMRRWQTLRIVLLRVLGHLLGGALKVALRGIHSCLGLLLLLIFNVLLLFTLLMCILHVW